ncbi:4Fe-4S dicluster domain-containing protein [Roseomonas elaeocarpi]|uniref:4Fe-4S dicluster domain-containing protein n=1 Tax=Roseomonas elaeocarpi TaxID=907779 RepID=A0ABV6JZE1_9PROT
MSSLTPPPRRTEIRHAAPAARSADEAGTAPRVGEISRGERHPHGQAAHHPHDHGAARHAPAQHGQGPQDQGSHDQPPHDHGGHDHPHPHDHGHPHAAAAPGAPAGTPANAAEAPALSRRQAGLALLAAGFGLSACKPAEQIVPYVQQPETVLPGVPQHYATALTLGGFARGVVATSFEGRPVKLEGNAAHPASLGATDAFNEAAILSLYDPDRSRVFRKNNRIGAREIFEAELTPRSRALAERGGEGLHILSGHLTSPTTLRLLREVRARFPAMHWHAHEPAGEDNALRGAQLTFGQPLRAVPRLERAAVILCLDADPLGPGPDQIRLGRGFAEGRRARRSGGPAAGANPDAASPRFNRLYAAEAVMSATGAKADHRLALPPAGLRDLLLALAARIGTAAPASAPIPEPPALAPEAQRFLDAVSADLLAHRGEAVVLVGPWQPPELHALAHWINRQLDAPVDYLSPPEHAAEIPEDLPALAAALRAGTVDTLLILGANPAYDAPGALGFADLLTDRVFTVHLGTTNDETARRCRWHLPETHPLEDWGDARATDGTVSIMQPLIEPLYRTVGAAWLLGALQGRFDGNGYAAVRATWAAAQPADFETWWRQALHDGVLPGTAATPVASPAATLPALPPAEPPPPGLVLLLRPDASAWDGRFSNNAWLQELPRPLTRHVWGNGVVLSPAEAERQGLRDGDVARLTVAGRSIEAAAMVLPGLAPGVLLLHLGYGRTGAGAMGDGLGVSAYALRPADGASIVPGLTLEKTDRQEPVLRPHAAHRLEGEDRTLFRRFDLAALAEAETPEEERPPSLMPQGADRPGAETQRPETPAWAMVIDTALCIGCNACVVACQSENNVPVVGPEEVARNRSMEWLRIDTYDLGTEAAPQPGFQPVPCMHCEQAPCEPVCPVAASVHDSEGLNVQVYNRCVGTRFCQANCPWKVRHFNFFGYNDGQEFRNLGDPVVAAAHNPEVTVRARGVMEKCTYCTQRISSARRTAEREHRPEAADEVRTACQSACPTSAIIFGNLKAANSPVAPLRQEPQHYALLGELGTRPRTTYLGAVRNANPALEGPAQEGPA